VQSLMAPATAALSDEGAPVALEAARELSGTALGSAADGGRRQAVVSGAR
jgi:hypothetical protein